MKFFKRQTGKRAQQRLVKADLSAVYAAVNALQNTPFRINQAIDRLQRDAWARGLRFFGRESREARARAKRERGSAKPQSKGEASSGEAQARQGEASSGEAQARQGEASSEDQRHERLRMQARERAARNQKGLEKMMVFRFGQAARLCGEERFYFPWQVDHRGRAYPVPPLMNPQSDHIGRALIEFADGKPLGDNRGVYWLAIHLVNCYWKGKKVSFKKRRAWVQQNEQEILDFAANPLRIHRFWTEADQPWLFLAACLEWKRYKEEGPAMISHLPISMDGSCNGYQHLSAMGLDPIGGRATNLMGFEDPEDIYQWVSDLVCRRLEADASVGQHHPGASIDASPYRARPSGRHPSSPEEGSAARQLLAIMDRELAKNATMTTPYRGTPPPTSQALCEKPAIQALKDSEKCAMY